MENLDTIEIGIVDIFKTILKRWWIVVISTVLCAVAVFVYGTLTTVPLYGLKVQFYISPEFGNAQSTTAVTAYQTYTYAKEAVLTYMALLESDEFYEAMEEDLQGKCRVDYSLSQLNSMISYRNIQDTDLFYATVVSQNPGDAYIIATQLAEMAPDRIRQIKGFDALKVTDNPRLDRVSRVNNNTRRNTIIGGFLGALLSAGIVILIKMFDVRISSEADLNKAYKLPVLAVIPDFNELMRECTLLDIGGRGGKVNKNDKK